MPSQYRCPQCGDDDRLHVSVSISLALIQYDGDPRLDDDDNGPHSLSEATEMYCSECYHKGPLSAFDTTGTDWADLGPINPTI